jgi:subtilase family serine protease
MRNELALASYESCVPAILRRFAAWMGFESLLKPSQEKPLKLSSTAKRTRRKGLERKLTLFASPVALFSLFTITSLAQTPATRITAEIDDSQRFVIPGTHPPMARAENDAGRLPSGTRLEGITIVFRRTPAQEVDLQGLIAAQQDPASPLYHKWLTPDDFAARFGVADSDIATVKLWIERQGFSVNGVSRSKNRIAFSGTVEQAEAAFGTELHYYHLGGQKRYAPSADISVPTALSSLVEAVRNLSAFRPKAPAKFVAPQHVPQAYFTSSQSGSHFLTPKDVATIYDINAAYSAGYTGMGQSIAIVGQTTIAVKDIENFQSAAGLTKKDPTLVLVPNSGTGATVSGDEAESDLDVEYSGGIAKDATIYFVYVGNNANYSVWDSLNYAVDSRTAPVISISYGTCETALASSDYSILNGILAQAATQGQTVVSASGDAGSTACFGETGLTTAQQETLAVSFPPSSQYVIALGGTEFPAADVASTNTTYWKSASGSDVVGSALSYIPEQVWNDDSSSGGLASGGGGVSTLTPRPSWQSGVSGIPSGSYRLVPDISLSASAKNAGFLYCSSDSRTGVTGSCSNGFRDSNSTYLTVAGGTSFGAPIFAGMLAIINQKENSTGQGVANSTLYSLAANSTTYSSVFHDITAGGNQCTAGANYCSTAGASEYSASTGYDLASGLGSVDFYNLLVAWPASSSLVATTTNLSAATTTPASGASDAITIVVASASASNTSAPTGTLTILVDGMTETSSLALSSGTATYTFSSSTAGSHTITATYSGDSIFASSTGNLTLMIDSTSKSFTLKATNVTVPAGAKGTSTVTITPQNGYTGTIGWSVSSSPTISNACFSLPDTVVAGTSLVTTTLTIRTNSAACASSAVRTGIGRRKMVGPSPITSGKGTAPLSTTNSVEASLVLAGLLLAIFIGFRSRGTETILGITILALIGVVACGCSGVPKNAPTGTYTLTIIGKDTASSSITASTTLTLTID